MSSLSNWIPWNDNFMIKLVQIVLLSLEIRVLNNMLEVRVRVVSLLFFLNLYLICYSIASVSCFGFSAIRHVGSWLPDQGLNPHPLHNKCGVLTTGLPGKSFYCCSKSFIRFAVGVPQR